MTVKELVRLLTALPNEDAEVIVRVPDANDPEAPDDYMIEDVTFMDWPAYYRGNGDPLRVAAFSKPQAYIRV